MTTFGMPPAYVGAPLVQPSANAGTCILTPSEVMIRPKIGGMRRSKKAQRKSKKAKKANRTKKGSRKQRAGFVPSIGEPFVAAAGKYVAPIALYGLYRYLKNKPTKLTRRGRKQRQ